MFSCVQTASIIGIEAISVQVEVEAARGLPKEVIVGLPDAAIKESKSRVKSAIQQSGFQYPLKVFTINLSPAGIRKEGPYFDIPMAMGILESTGQIKIPENSLFVGELSLKGDIYPVKGIIAIAQKAAREKRTLFLPSGNESEVQWVEGLSYYPSPNLKDLVKSLHSTPKTSQSQHTHALYTSEIPDLSEVRGQFKAKRALEIAAAGHHHLLLTGPPGAGKTMLLKRLPGILPPLTISQALESMQLYSLSQNSKTTPHFSLMPPIRMPHHSISYAGLVGGGSFPRPGEISLAHNGVLVLDEFPEFNRRTIEVLRQPLEDSKVTLSRAAQTITFPAEFLLAVALNPCPCGYYGTPEQRCTQFCTKLGPYLGKISGPILDRIDIKVEVSKPSFEDLTTNVNKSKTSPMIQEKVQNARERQYYRQGKLNSHLSPIELQKLIHFTPSQQTLIKTAYTGQRLSARSFHKLIKVARTIADLDQSNDVTDAHLLETLGFIELPKGMIG